MGQAINFTGNQKYWAYGQPIEHIAANNLREGTAKYWYKGQPISQIQRPIKKKKFVLICG